jgi:hypothetical protein
LIVAEANATKNIFDGRKDRGKAAYHPPHPGSGGIIKLNQSMRTENEEFILNINHRYTLKT